MRHKVVQTILKQHGSKISHVVLTDAWVSQVEGTCVVYRSMISFSIAVWTDWRVAEADDGASIATSVDSARSRRKDTLVIIIFVVL